ncbi:hypothetical protein BU16DRAFT_617921, partial [Lophium mytilinum]
MSTMRTLKSTGSGRFEKEDPIAKQRREKKRIQNRNAQRSHREKQAAYIRTLEKMVSDAVPAGGQMPDAACQSAQTQANWIEEIRELQEALLRMRKKFQSLSFAAASNAEDLIFKRILNLQSLSRAETPRSPRQPQQGTPFHIAQSVESVLDPSGTLIEWGQDTDLATLFADDYLHNGAPPPSIPCSHSEFNQALVLQPNVCVSPPGSVSSASSKSSLAESLRVEDVYPSTDILGVERTLKTVLEQSENRADVDRSVSLAVRIMLKRSPLIDGIFSLMGGAEAVERVIHWRIAPTAANRDKIPAPFRPTVLQQHFPEHNYGIDFLYWAELRDQLMLQNDIDIGQLVEDCLRNLVQEVPQLNLSLPLVETYFHLIELVQTNSEQQLPSPVERFLDLTYSDDDREPLRLHHPHYKVFRAVEKYQLDELSNRKMMPNFAEKYPSLDLTNIITKFPVASFG